MSYAFDKIGHLIRRTDHSVSNSPGADNITETFEYDDLNRLKAEFLDYNTAPETTYGYDASGNLTQKGEVILSYDETGNAGPHAVTSATTGLAGIDLLYDYDSVGNVVSRHRGSGLEAIFDYTSFDKPHTIVANGWRAEISYDANRNRYIRKDIKSGGGERKITHYLGNVEYIYENGGIKSKRYIGHLVINIDNETNSRQRWAFNYLLKDHIGSTHTVANRFGNAIVNMSFNAWGQRRVAPRIDQGNNYDVIPITQVWTNFGSGLRAQIDETTNRGFTGHEHFDQVGIIHMNGRIYDPTIGRFLQADPIIQDPYDTQSLNRYSYVMNNPLSYTDPTGYTRLRKGAIFNTVASIAISVFLPGSTAIFGSSVQAGATLFSSAVTGAVVGVINTGNLKGAVKGGIFAAISFGIGHKFKGFDNVPGIGTEGSSARIFAHALVSGVSAEVDGGNFGHGFASAFLSQHIGKNRFFHKGGSAGRIVSNAILQGTISEVTGGKFANGAVTAGFRVAFNDMQNAVISEGAKLNPNWTYGDRINGQLVDAYGDPSPAPGMILRRDGLSWQTPDGAASEAAFGPRYNGVESKISFGVGEANFFFKGTSTDIFKSDTSSCVVVVDCELYGLGVALQVSRSVKTTWTSYDSVSCP